MTTAANCSSLTLRFPNDTFNPLRAARLLHGLGLAVGSGLNEKPTMPKVRSCGVVVFKRDPLSFLLMRHLKRWDLPKGHVDPGETDLECAMRELNEETGITADDIELDEAFCFKHHYVVRDRDYPEQNSNKTLLIYLGWLQREVEIIPTEHPGFEWFTWNPPHAIQEATIDPLLAALAEHLHTNHGFPST